MEAPDRFRLVGLRLAAGGDNFHDVLQVVRRDSRAQPAHGGEAIVDPAPVDDPVAGRDHEGLRHHAGAETQGQIAGAVQNDRERDPEFVHKICACLPRDAGVREDAVERHAILLRIAMELVERRYVSRGEGPAASGV